MRFFSGSVLYKGMEIRLPAGWLDFNKWVSNEVVQRQCRKQSMWAEWKTGAERVKNGWAGTERWAGVTENGGAWAERWAGGWGAGTERGAGLIGRSWAAQTHQVTRSRYSSSLLRFKNIGNNNNLIST